MNDKIEMKSYQSSGSFNITYIKEYRATIPTLIISLFNKSWNVIKEEEILLDNETVKEYEVRDKLFMDESISNAIYVAYTKANRQIKILDHKNIVLYIDKNAKTDLKVGDVILKIDNIKINYKEEISNILNKYNIGDKINLVVKNENNEYNRYVELIELENEKKLGILLVTINEYETQSNIKVNIGENESGSSGGLITALTIYNNLIEKDITRGLTIVGTGTIDMNGNVGSIGGVSYKLKSAVKEKADLFIVPNDENYDEAIKIKKENDYNIDILGVDTFDEVISYLGSLKN